MQRELRTKRRFRGLEQKQRRAGYVFVIPVIIGLVFFFLPMLYETILFSFNNVSMTKDGYELSFIGLYQYKKLLTTDAWYIKTATGSLVNILRDFFCILVFSFFVGVLLNQKFVGRTAARAIFFLPVILSTGIIATLEAQDTIVSALTTSEALDIGTNGGLGILSVKELLTASDIAPKVTATLIDMVDGLYNIMVSSGVQILLFISALQSVPSHLYEAAKVEGATGWEAFWKITLPMISPIILLNGVYTVIDSCTKSTNPIMSQVLHETSSQNYTVSSAMAIIYLLAVAVIVALIFLFSRKLVFYQE